MLALIAIAQQLRLGAATGIDVNVLGQAKAQVKEAQQGMSLGMVLAALTRSAAPIVDALVLAGVKFLSPPEIMSRTPRPR